MRDEMRQDPRFGSADFVQDSANRYETMKIALYFVILLHISHFLRKLKNLLFYFLVQSFPRSENYVKYYCNGHLSSKANQMVL